MENASLTNIKIESQYFINVYKRMYLFAGLSLKEYMWNYKADANFPDYRFNNDVMDGKRHNHFGTQIGPTVGMSFHLGKKYTLQFGVEYNIELFKKGGKSPVPNGINAGFFKFKYHF